MHLFVGETYPNSFREWMDHALGYELFHKQFQEFGHKYGFHSISNFPVQFRTDVINAISSLIKKQNEIAEFELPSPINKNQDKPNQKVEPTRETPVELGEV